MAVRALRRYSIFTVALICIGLADCSSTTPAARYAASGSRGQVVYVIAGGWHTELGLSVADITGPLAALKSDFPTARYLVFGWGAHDYYMARNPGIGDLLRAAISGPAVILAIPLQVLPEAFFGASNAFAIPASQDGTQRLSQFLWDYLVVDTQGPPRRVGTGPYPQSVFYASAGTYNFVHTCNTWTAEALRVAGLPVNAAGVVFADQVLNQLPLPLGASNERSERALTPLLDS